MADKKISEMTSLTASQIASDDNIVIADTSANHTKRAQISELATFFGVNTEGQQDLVADMFVNGTMTGISVTYDDPNGVMNFSLAGGVTTAEMGHLNGVTSDIQTQFNSKAPLSSPALTGNPTAPTQSANDNSTKISTTAFVQGELTGYASDSATFTNKGGAISQWTNDSGYITPSSTSTLTNKSGSISQWTNNSGYITATSTDTLQNKTINGSDNTISNVPYSALTSIVDTDITSVSGSDDEIASSKAIKTYVDAQISGIDTIAEAGDTAITSPSSGQILVYDGSDSFDNKTASVTLTGAVTGTANMSSTGAVSVATTIPTNTITINGQAVALGGSATIPSVLQSGGTFTGELHLNDNVKLSLGGASGSGDFSISHESSTGDTIFAEGGSGNLVIKADDFKIMNQAGTENILFAQEDGLVRLFYDNSTKLETANGGIDVTGNIVVSGTVDGRDVATDGTKLDGISSGAEVNVQANWTEASNTSDAFIQNKPSLSTVATSGSYNDLSNKPTIPSAVTNNNQLTNGAGYVTTDTNTTYSAGTHIGLSGTTFSLIPAVDNWISDSNGRERIYFSGNSHSYWKSSNNHYWRTNNSNTDQMLLDTSGNLVVNNNVTAYGSPSDENLKDNIEIIPNALDKVSQLRGVTFNYKKDGNKSTGLIAQDLEKVLPEVVYDFEDLDTKETNKAVRYGNVVGLLVESIKELKARNEKLELIVNRLITEVEEK